MSFATFYGSQLTFLGWLWKTKWWGGVNRTIPAQWLFKTLSKILFSSPTVKVTVNFFHWVIGWMVSRSSSELHFSNFIFVIMFLLAPTRPDWT